ncbi:MAG: hypothetical protein FWD47_11400 [Treponema sp.]|nr:hypothetical protein [Treponema sp.]
MKNKYLFLSILFTFFLASCSDSVFHMVSLDEKIKKPLIKGSPTNFVQIGSVMYVASGSRLYSYSADEWNTSLPNPGGRIVQLAVHGGNLHILCFEGSSTNGIIKYTTNPESGTWSTIPGVNAHSIHSNGTNLYYSFRVGESYNIYQQGNSTPIIPNASQELQGVSGSLLCAGTIYTTSGGIHNSSLPTNFMGIINVSSTNYAITRDGDLYNLSSNAKVADFSGFISNTRATGLLTTVYDSTGTVLLLLAGRQDVNYSTNSGFTYGYAEIAVSNLSSPVTKFHMPGSALPSTIINRDRYTNTLGKNPVSHILQFPFNNNGIIFSSTQRNGVWQLIDDTWNTVPE